MKSQSLFFLLALGLLTASIPFAGAAQSNSVSSAAQTDLVMGIPKSELAPEFSGGVNEVVRLVRSGVEEAVVVAFIQNSSVPYHPGAEEIIKLRDEGISSKTIAAMLQRGGELRSQATQTQPAPPATYGYANTQPPAVQPQPAVTYAEPAYPAPASTVVYFGGTPAYTYPVVYSGYGGLGYTHYYYHNPYYYSCSPSVGFNYGITPRVSFGVNFGGNSFRTFGGGSHFNGGARPGGGLRRH